MRIEPIGHFRRAVRIAHSRHPAARLVRLWRSIAGDPAEGVGAADILLLPLAGLTLTLLVLGSVPGAGDAIASACASVCMP